MKSDYEDNLDFAMGLIAVIMIVVALLALFYWNKSYWVEEPVTQYYSELA